MVPPFLIMTTANVILPSSQIALILVTYQSGEHIQACLASLPHANVEHELQLILIDNASTDNTRAEIQAALQQLPRERISYQLICNETNLGFTRAVNQGLALVPEGAAVLFLNPDTVLPPGSLCGLMKSLWVDEKLGVVAPQLRFPANAATPREMIQPSCRRFPTYRDLLFEFIGLAQLFPQSAFFNRWKMGEFEHRTSREVEQPQGACLLARPEVIRQVGMWDERFPLFFSDVDWCRRVRQAGWKIYFNAEVFIYHAQGASVKQVRPRAIWSSHVSFWRYFRKWRTTWWDEILSVLIALPLFFAAVLRMAWSVLRQIGSRQFLNRG